MWHVLRFNISTFAMCHDFVVSYLEKWSWVGEYQQVGIWPLWFHFLFHSIAFTSGNSLEIFIFDALSTTKENKEKEKEKCEDWRKNKHIYIDIYIYISQTKWKTLDKLTSIWALIILLIINSPMSFRKIIFIQLFFPVTMIDLKTISKKKILFLSFYQP